MNVTVSLETSGPAPCCHISGVLDFTTAGEALSQVNRHIGEHAVLNIDLNSVTRSNSAGLALLIEWLAEAQRANHKVTFHHIPDGLRQLAGVCQVDGLI